jgi:hypothetical protein
MAARAVAAVRQAEEMAEEPTVRVHTKFDEDGNVVTSYEEQVYDEAGVLRGATDSDEDEIDAETMATIMDAAVAMETIQFTSGGVESPVAGIAPTTDAAQWRGQHIHFDSDDEEQEEQQQQEDDLVLNVVVGKNPNATTSGKPRVAAVRVSDSPAPAGRGATAASKVQIEEIDELVNAMSMH